MEINWGNDREYGPQTLIVYSNKETKIDKFKAEADRLGKEITVCASHSSFMLIIKEVDFKDFCDIINATKM